ncbi:hypothetical protein WN48_05312 [Eufriesea mexicana]|nr:hypothetical protein WN48_05312 [Eufriesea mexicana]
MARATDKVGHAARRAGDAEQWGKDGGGVMVLVVVGWVWFVAGTVKDSQTSMGTMDRNRHGSTFCRVQTFRYVNSDLRVSLSRGFPKAMKRRNAGAREGRTSTVLKPENQLPITPLVRLERQELFRGSNCWRLSEPRKIVGNGVGRYSCAGKVEGEAMEYWEAERGGKGGIVRPNSIQN